MAEAELLVFKDKPSKHVTTLVLNRPTKGNSLTSNMTTLLIGALEKCADAACELHNVLTHARLQARWTMPAPSSC